MANTYSGQAKNVPNFSDVIDIITELGPKWNPVLEDLSIAALKARHAAAEILLNDYSNAFAFDQLKTAERAKVYESLNATVRRIYAAAQACKMTASTVDRIKALKDLIDGTNIAQAAARRDKKEEKMKANLIEGEAAPDTPKTRSVSQQTFDERLDNFKQLIVLLTASGEYKTNEPDMTIEGLNTFLNSLVLANKATSDADKALTDMRILRNDSLSGEENSILSAVKDIKNHLIMMESKSGNTYKKVAAIKFK